MEINQNQQQESYNTLFAGFALHQGHGGHLSVPFDLVLLPHNINALLCMRTKIKTDLEHSWFVSEYFKVTLFHHQCWRVVLILILMWYHQHT